MKMLIDVDGHNFPNFALMKISGYHKAVGDSVEWATPFDSYDRIYSSKVFTFSPDFNRLSYKAGEFVLGGTGYDIASRLPEEIEAFRHLDYSIYPNYKFSIQFFSRGCIRHCPFCLVHDKEGYIHPVEPVDLNPNGEYIEVLDNNFFANPEWRAAADYLIKAGQPVKFNGVDIRIMDEEQAYYINKIRLKNYVHIAWDLPQIDLTEKLESALRYIRDWKLVCYILVGYNSTREQDLFRLETCRRLKIRVFVMPFRDYENKRKPTQYERDLAHWANNRALFMSCSFLDYEIRKGFYGREYFK